MSTPFDHMTAAEMKHLMDSDPVKFRELEKQSEVAVADPKAPRVFRNGRLLNAPPPAKE
jgi:hypothetical protein